jgi:hypothetical protein
MQPEELEIGATYFYQGDLLKWTNVTYQGKAPNFYGNAYIFDVSIGGRQIDQYTLSLEGLDDLCYPSTMTVTTQPAQVLAI